MAQFLPTICLIKFKKMKMNHFVMALALLLFAMPVVSCQSPEQEKTDNLITDTASLVAPTMYIDFSDAAEKSIHAVVHIKTKFSYTTQQNDGFYDLFDFFFGTPPEKTEPQTKEMPGAAGSGVIISHDGYIVTNNHVIEDASSIEVTLNDKRTFSAQIVGNDPSTDLALLKIEQDSLPTIAYGNSDKLKVGEWVLAVGNPFNLTSTVTAGIVSAKARNINILSDNMKIESFIQTDAAVNPGNSGGALVNTAGELVGINTAIASQTGSYTGYSFAIPTSIVQKVVEDLKEFKVVQRAILGTHIQEITNELAKEKKLSSLVGVYVASVFDNGGAQKAGIKEGDVILSIAGNNVVSVAELQEQVSRFRPGDKIEVTVMRKSNLMTFEVELLNRSGNTKPITTNDWSEIGAEFKEVDQNTKYKFRISAGLEVVSTEKGGKMAEAGVLKGFVILKVNKKTIASEKDFYAICDEVMNSAEEDKILVIGGFYPNGVQNYYVVNLK